MQRIEGAKLRLAVVAAWSVFTTFGCGLDEGGAGTSASGSSASSASSSSSGTGGQGGMTSSSSSGVGGEPATSSSSSGSGGMGGMPGQEQCTDGMDNDGDKLVDCGDKDSCGALFSCNAQAPGAWSYVRIRQTAYGAAKEPCGGGVDPKVLYENPDAGQCNGCSCNAPGKCQVAMTCYGTDNCAGGGASNTYSTDADACTLDTLPVVGGSCQLTGGPMVPNGAVCNSVGGGLMNTDPFAGEVHLCPTVSKTAGCGGMDSCVLAPSGSYEERLCVTRPGSLPCPAGFPEQHFGYGAFTDMRACSACTCNASSITCVGTTTVTLWSDPNCTQNPKTVSTNSGCVDVPPGTTYRNVTDIPSMNVGVCPQPFPQGSVITTDQNTVCCATP